MSEGTPQGLAELKALGSIIQNAINSIEAKVASKGIDFPSLSTPTTPESEAASKLPEVEQASALIVAAAYQLIQSVRSPALTLVAIATQYMTSAALGVATAANVAEVLRDAGPQGAHVNDIAKASNIDPAKLARLLRLLATNHIFVELSPDVFANNRISSYLDTGKTIETILKRPQDKHVDTPGQTALIGHLTDEGLKSSSYLEDALLGPETAKLHEPNETAFNLAFKTDMPYWQWLETPENEQRLARFGIAMKGGKQSVAPNSILEGFDWEGLKEGSLVVDVGGGIGSQTAVVARHCPHLRFIIQDREPVMKDAAAFLGHQLPEALNSGRVTLQPHDFFEEQPVKNTSVFLLHNVVHDWPDAHSTRILRRLRDAATPETRLLLVDSLLSYPCEDDSVRSVPGVQLPAAPKPLLPNMGHASSPTYSVDLLMMTFLNGQERTILHMKQLLQQAGWMVLEAYQTATVGTSKVIAAPI